MKLSLFSITSLTFASRLNIVSAQTTINISDPDQLPSNFSLPETNCTVDSEVSPGTVTCPFENILGPGDAILSMEVLGYDCNASFDAASFNNTNVTSMTPDSDITTSGGTYDAVAEVGYESGYDGTISFCVRTDLSDEGEEMIFRANRVNMTFTYNGTFSVQSFNTETYNGISLTDTTASKNFGVNAYICNANGVRNENPGALAIGEFLFVCVEAEENGTVIESFNTFRATKSGDSSPLDIDNGDSNIAIAGTNTNLVIAVINFPARFFVDNSPVIINGFAVVKQSSARRLASPRLYTRGLQAANESEEAEFGMLIDVVSDESSATGHDMIATAFAGLASLLLV